MAESKKVSALKRAARMLELQQKVINGQRAKEQYDTLYNRFDALSRYYSVGRSYEADYETQQEIRDLQSEMAKLVPIIKEGIRAQKSLTRMQQTDAKKEAEQQRVASIAEQQQIYDDMENKIDKLIKDMESYEINMSVDYSEELTEDSRKALEYKRAELDKMISDQDSASNYLYCAQREK